MSIKRPKATDTEDDLLALQESFLSHGEKPSVLLKKVKVQNVSDSAGQSRGRDVVRLSDQGMKSVLGDHTRIQSSCAGGTQVKKSKFKAERERERLAKKVQK